MGYVFIAVIFVLVIAAGIALFVSGSRRSQARAAADDDSSRDVPFSGRDATPAGDSAEHAGDQDESGRTQGEPDARRRSGQGPTADLRAGPARLQRDPIGGEAEAAPSIPDHTPRP